MKMPAEAGRMGDNWVPVWNSLWLHEAYSVKSVLEADGIDVRIPDEYTVGVHQLLASAIGGVRVLVHASDEARAAEILAQLPADARDASED